MLNRISCLHQDDGLRKGDLTQFGGKERKCGYCVRGTNWTSTRAHAKKDQVDERELTLMRPSPLSVL